MRIIMVKGSYNLAGLVFTRKGESYFLREWVEAGCPDNSYIKASPDILILCGIPIADADVFDGLLIRVEPRKPSKCKLRIPNYVLSHIKPKSSFSSTVNGIRSFSKDEQDKVKKLH